MNRAGPLPFRKYESGSRRNAALAVALFLALTGCKKSSSSNSGEYVCSDHDHASYIAQSKEYLVSDGEGVVTPASAKPIVEGYFGKKYNQDWLASVGHSSIIDTIDFIESTGATVYHSDPISKISNLNLESTPVMPWDIDRVWREADQPISGSSCAFLAGLYLGQKTRGLPTLRKQAAIIVREDAGRWTLVHEFMHHNFKTQAAAAGYNDDLNRNLGNKLFNAISVLKKDHSLSDRDYAIKVSALFQQLIDVIDVLVIQYQFEEVTVEATLQDKYRIGELTYVPAGSYQNASWYIDHSKTSIQNLYNALTSMYDELSLLTSTNGLFDLRRGLDRYVPMRDLRLGQLDDFIAKRQALAKRQGLMADYEFTPTSGYAPCAHAKAMEDQMTAIADAMRAPRERN